MSEQFNVNKRIKDAMYRYYGNFKIFWELFDGIIYV